MEYVSDTADAKAREIERRFQELPPEAGVIFVAVTPVPVEGGQAETYDVFLGISRSFTTEYGVDLIENVLGEELRTRINELHFRAKVHRGVIGTCRDERPATARQAEA